MEIYTHYRHVIMGDAASRHLHNGQYYIYVRVTHEGVAVEAGTMSSVASSEKEASERLDKYLCSLGDSEDTLVLRSEPRVEAYADRQRNLMGWIGKCRAVVIPAKIFADVSPVAVAAIDVAQPADPLLQLIEELRTTNDLLKQLVAKP